MNDTDTPKPQRRSALALQLRSPAHMRPDVDVETFKGLSGLEDRKAWMEAMYDRAPPEIRTIALCGSGRFRREFVEWNAELTRQGFLVFTIGVLAAGNPLTTASPIEKATVDAVHFAKIRMADAIVVIDAKVDGKPYIGESTAAEIAWAEQLGRPVFYTGDHTGWDHTKPNPEPWAAYSGDHLAEKARWLDSVLAGLYRRCPAAAIAKADSIYVPGVHEEYGFGSEVDENQIAEQAEDFPEGSRHIVEFHGTIGSAALVIDRNSFDAGLGRQAVRWHLEVLTDELETAIDAERRARLEAAHEARKPAETKAEAE